MLSFHVKFVQSDRRTTAKQYAPDLSMWGHKKISSNCKIWLFSGKLQSFISHISQVNPFPNKPWFLNVHRTSLLKTVWEKEKLHISNFSISHSVFYLSGELSAIFIKFEIVVCKLQLEESKIYNLGEG